VGLETSPYFVSQENESRLLLSKFSLNQFQLIGLGQESKYQMSGDDAADNTPPLVIM